MMIVGARSYWSIVKLLVCMLVFFFSNLIGNHVFSQNTQTCSDGSVISSFISCPETIDLNDITPPPPVPTENWWCPVWLTPSAWWCINEEWYADCKWDAKCEALQRSLNDWVSASDSSKLKKCTDSKYHPDYCKCKILLKWIYLNTEVPFVWAPNNPRCLVLDGTWWWATTVLQSLTKILMTFVMIGGFGMIVWWGVQIAAGDVKWGKEKIIWVVIAFALLWSLWVILRFINPNFFS